MSLAEKKGKNSVNEGRVIIFYDDEELTITLDEIKSVTYETKSKLRSNLLFVYPSLVVLAAGLLIAGNSFSIPCIIVCIIIPFFMKSKYDVVTINLKGSENHNYKIDAGHGIMEVSEIEKFLIGRRMEIEKEKQHKIEVNTSIKYEKLDQLVKELKDLESIQVVNVDEFKSILVNNEESIKQKEGDQILFSFLKIDAFLKDYKNKITSDLASTSNRIDVSTIRQRIKEEAQRTDDVRKIGEYFGDIAARLEGRQVQGFDAKLDQLFEVGYKMKPYFEGLNNTLNYYHNIGLCMLAFYLSDKKIQYFEIYSSFEKMGVFDSTWHKNVLLKLDSIENRLAQMGDQLIKLNNNFERLVESTNSMVAELKNINSSIVTNNLLQALTFFQTWRINRNLKNLN
jgi:hypothetical protein